jgi:two-component system, sensor histidine kinase PdtaS
MATTAEITRYHTTLPEAAVGHLQRLVATWGLLADLCFADLLLLAPVTRADVLGDAVTGRTLVVLGQVRPLTSQTLHRIDLVGAVTPASERPEVFRCWERGEILDVERPVGGSVVRILCVPVRFGGEVVAVLTRESAPDVGRQPGELERVYVEVFNRLARMVAAGLFPFSHVEGLSDESPRVGDGLLVLDGAGRVEFASPNAVSAMHRLGYHANAEGATLGVLGIDEASVRAGFARRRPVVEEVERGPEVTVVAHCLPLVEAGETTGGVVLLRDISELRRRDRLLMTKDATIREIHHRVKNNLQTISSLLRLQGRRLTSPEAKTGIEDSVRRIRAIATVHETLAHGVGDDVPFADVLDALVRMVAEGLVDPEQPVAVEVEGSAGVLPGTVATSLAVVLSELLTNVVEHGYPDRVPVGGGRVVVALDNDGQDLRVRIVDDGIGVAEEFDIDATTSLGLSIVRTLVTSELHGTIIMRRGTRPPTDERTDSRAGPGTVVEIWIPLGDQAEPITGSVPVVRV